MRTHGLVICVLVIAWLAIAPCPASAGVALYDWAFNVNGTVYASPAGYSGPLPGALPAFFNTSGYNWSTGLGTITIDYRPGPGSYFFAVFVDHEIDNSINGPYNEYAADPDVALLAAGQTWEVDEPGWNADPAFPMGDIYWNATGSSNALDNSNGLPFPNPYNVSMALGWNFLVGSGERAVISLDLTTAGPPASGFWLEQHDLDSADVIYMSGNAQVVPSGVIPEPGTLLLMAAGLAAVAAPRIAKRR